MVKKVLVIVTILVLFTGLASAADVKLKDIKVSGVVFSQYSYNLMEKGADYNAFEITRTYLIFKSNLAERIGLRLTLDSGRWSAASPSSLQVFIKHMYIDIKDVIGSSTLSVGMLDLPWVPFVESIWKYRFVSKVFADSEGKQTSTDLGIKLGGDLIGKYLEYYLVFVNGEGYASPEVNKTKDGYTRITFTPMPDSLKGLRISAHHRAGLVNVEQKRDRTMAMISLEQDDWTLATETLYTIDQSAQGKGEYAGFGYSIFGFYKLGANFSLLGRYDWFDPDINPDKTKNTHFRTIFGLGYDISDGIKITLDNQQVVYEDKAGTGNENVVYAHMLINF